MSRRGVGLAEVMVALSLTGVIGSLTMRLLLTTAFRLREQSERMAEEHALRAGAGAIRASLESLGQDSLSGADLLGTGSASLLVRATRAAGVACATAPGIVTVRADTAWWHALRALVPGRDSILAGRLDSLSWQHLALVAPLGNASCPDGSRGLTLSLSGPPGAQAGIAAGSPILAFEPIELRQYSSPPDRWLGMRLVATTQPVQPFAGPLQPNGLSFSYLRRDGSLALLPAEVAAIEVGLAAVSERAGGIGPVRGPAARPDSLRLFVALRDPP